jgi:hypothetical protein
MGTGYRHDHSYIYEQPARGIARSFAGNGLEVPLIDAETRAVAMPWKYCTGLLVESDEYWVSSTVPSLAAYGLDMLDERLPGLYEDAVASRQDPDLVRRFKERINSIRPGLYEEQAVMPYDAVHFQAGLRRIIGALGLEHATITG